MIQPLNGQYIVDGTRLANGEILFGWYTLAVWFGDRTNGKFVYAERVLDIVGKRQDFIQEYEHLFGRQVSYTWVPIQSNSAVFTLTLNGILRLTLLESNEIDKIVSAVDNRRDYITSYGVIIPIDHLPYLLESSPPGILPLQKI